MSNEPDFSLGGSRVDTSVDEPSVQERGQPAAVDVAAFYRDVGQFDALSSVRIDLSGAPGHGEIDENTVVERMTARLMTDRS